MYTESWLIMIYYWIMADYDLLPTVQMINCNKRKVYKNTVTLHTILVLLNNSFFINTICKSEIQRYFLMFSTIYFLKYES